MNRVEEKLSSLFKLSVMEITKTVCFCSGLGWFSLIHIWLSSPCITLNCFFVSMFSLKSVVGKSSHQPSHLLLLGIYNQGMYFLRLVSFLLCPLAYLSRHKFMGFLSWICLSIRFGNVLHNSVKFFTTDFLLFYYEAFFLSLILTHLIVKQLFSNIYTFILFFPLFSFFFCHSCSCRHLLRALRLYLLIIVVCSLQMYSC